MNFSSENNRLKYQAFYRGCKENEILFREFFNLYFHSFDTKDVQLFSEVVQIDDGLLLDYLYSRKDFRKSIVYKKNAIFKKFLEWCTEKIYVP